eukprot:45943_1
MTVSPFGLTRAAVLNVNVNNTIYTFGGWNGTSILTIQSIILGQPPTTTNPTAMPTQTPTQTTTNPSLHPTKTPSTPSLNPSSYPTLNPTQSPTNTSYPATQPTHRIVIT